VLLLGLVPLIIHLLMRFRTRRVRWGANYLLERALDRLAARRNWLVYLLLATRTLAITLLALSFLQPFLVTGTDVATEGGTIHFIAVDDSYSMSAEQPGADGDAAESRWDAARALLEDLTSRWAIGERYGIYTLTGGVEPVIEPSTLTRRGKISDHFNQIEFRDGTVNLGEALERFERIAGGQPYEVILVSDRQKLNWQDAKLDRVPAPRSTLWICPPGPLRIRRPSPSDNDRPARATTGQQPNLYLESIQLPGHVVLQNDTVSVRVQARSSSDARGPQRMTIALGRDGQQSEVTTRSILPGQPTTFDFEVQFPRPGYTYLSASIETADGLIWDNRISAGLLVRPEAKVLVVDDPSIRPFDRPWSYLHRAGAERDAASSLKFMHLQKTANPWDSLAEFDVVLIGNGGRIPEGRWPRLREFVRRGGGLIFSVPPVMSERLAGADIWNAAFSSQKTLSRHGTESFSILPSSIRHPALEALMQNGSDGLRDVRFYGYWRVDPGKEATVLAQFDTGDPWIVGSTHGLGRIIVLTSGIDGRWNTLPVHTAFQHFLHRIVSFAQMGAVPPLNVKRGREILLRDGAGAKRYLLSGPRGRSGRPTLLRSKAVERAGVKLHMFGGNLKHNGLYVVRPQSETEREQRYVGIYDDRTEGDTAPLSTAREEEIARKLGARIIDSEQRLADYLEESRGGRDISNLLLVVGLAVLFVESLLTLRIGA
jgi:hypothetical protein